MKRNESGNTENMFEGANVGRIVSTCILRDALHGFVRVQFRIIWMFFCFRFSHSQQRKSGGGGRHNNLLILLTIYTSSAASAACTAVRIVTSWPIRSDPNPGIPGFELKTICAGDSSAACSSSFLKMKF